MNLLQHTNKNPELALPPAGRPIRGDCSKSVREPAPSAPRVRVWLAQGKSSSWETGKRCALWLLGAVELITPVAARAWMGERELSEFHAQRERAAKR